MAGVWVFKNGIVKLIDRPTKEKLHDGSSGGRARLAGKRSFLIHAASGRVVRSHEELERYLAELGWQRYLVNGEGEGEGEEGEAQPRRRQRLQQQEQSSDLIQYHRCNESPDLISLPRRFSDVTSIHMYDIAVKCRFSLLVRDRLQPEQQA